MPVKPSGRDPRPFAGRTAGLLAFAGADGRKHSVAASAVVRLEQDADGKAIVHLADGARIPTAEPFAELEFHWVTARGRATARPAGRRRDL